MSHLSDRARQPVNQLTTNCTLPVLDTYVKNVLDFLPAQSSYGPLGACLSQAGVLSKQPNGPSWFLVWSLCTACHRVVLGIRFVADMMWTCFLCSSRPDFDRVAVASAGSYASLRSLQTQPRQHPSTLFTGRVPFLPPNQQRQSTESSAVRIKTQCVRIAEREGEIESRIPS